MLICDDKLTNPATKTYWSADSDTIAESLGSSPHGLSTAEALRRLQLFGRNELQDSQPRTRLTVLLDQIKSPLLLLLVFAAAASFFTGQWMDATIVVAIVALTVFIGYSREYRAESAAAALKARVRVKTTVLRDGKPGAVPIQEIVPGDVVFLSAGSLVPGDGIVLEAADCFLSEAVLTGESFPVEKIPGAVPADTPLARRQNSVFLGTNVRSGTARCLIVRTGRETQFGNIAHRLALRPPETEFDRGIKRFGYFLTTAMLIMVVVVFTAHALQGRRPIETLLFAIALAVGLSPELLPAILSVNLARGAQLMADRGVLSGI
jgi:P-type Mg2+ transporter